MVLVLLLLLWWCCGGVVVLLLLGGGGDGRLIPAYSAERWPAHPPHLPATPPRCHTPPGCPLLHQALMREQVRNMDRAMSNIESMPGGFNALRQFHSTMQVI